MEALFAFLVLVTMFLVRDYLKDLEDNEDQNKPK
jgi:hypothetical protein